MEWILSHLQLLFIGAGAVAWWVNQRRQAGAAEAAPPAREKTSEDPELAERTRRIRAEIQRKIEERTRGSVAAGTPPRAPAPAQAPVTARRVVRSPRAPRAMEAAVPRVIAPAPLPVEPGPTLARMPALGSLLPAAESPRNPSRTGERDDLRDPAALRRAIVLREILGPPVALRR